MVSVVHIPHLAKTVEATEQTLGLEESRASQGKRNIEKSHCLFLLDSNFFLTDSENWFVTATQAVNHKDPVSTFECETRFDFY